MGTLNLGWPGTASGDCFSMQTFLCWQIVWCNSIIPLHKVPWKSTGNNSQLSRKYIFFHFSASELYAFFMTFEPFKENLTELNVPVFKVKKKHPVCQRCYNEILQMGRLMQQKIIFSQFWRLEVLYQVVSEITFFRGSPFGSQEAPPVWACLFSTRAFLASGLTKTQITLDPASLSDLSELCLFLYRFCLQIQL